MISLKMSIFVSSKPLIHTIVMRTKLFMMSLAIFSILFYACSSGSSEIPTNGNEPNNGEVITKSDTVSLKIGYQMTEYEEPLFKSRAESNSNDLIGIQIMNETSATRLPYACGVFDDIEKLVFKFVKGNKYQIMMNYYPNAKNIVYKNANGTYGVPFWDFYGMTKYSLNKPYYYTGPGPEGTGNRGTVLSELMNNYVQTTSNSDFFSHKRGLTVRYLGYSELITIEENTKITVPLELYMKGITLNVGNFNEGSLRLSIDYAVKQEWTFNPGDNMSVIFQIPGRYDLLQGHDYWGSTFQGENMTLFYTDKNNETFLLASKFIPYEKCGINHVFTFDLMEREDGSIGIKMPNESMKNEETEFD